MDNVGTSESWVGRQAESENGWGDPPLNPEDGYWPGSEEPENTTSSDQDPPSSNKKGQNETGGRNTQSSHVKKNNHKDNLAPNAQGDSNWRSSPKMDNDRNDWEPKKVEKGRGRNPEKDRADDKSPNWVESPRKFQQKGGGSWRDNNNNKNSHRRDWNEDSEPRSPRGRGRGGASFPRHERDNYRRDPRGDSDFRSHDPRSPPPPRGDGNRYSDRHEKTNDDSMKESSSKVGSLNDSIHAPKQDPPYVNKDRVLSGGNAHQRMCDEELSKRMEQIQLQNKKLLEKRKIVEEDEEAFRKEEEEFRKKELENLEIQRKKREEEEEDKRRRDFQQKQLQEQLDNEREENARLKIKNQGNREWDKEKDETSLSSRQRNNFDSRNNSYRSGNDNEADRKSSRSEDSNYDRRNSRQGGNEHEDYERRNSRGNGGDYGRRNSRGNHNEFGPRNNYRGDNNFGKNSRSGRGRGGRGRGGGGGRGAANPHGTTVRRQSSDQNRDPYKPTNGDWDDDVSAGDTWNETKNQSKSEDQDDGGWGVPDVAASEQGTTSWE